MDIKKQSPARAAQLPRTLPLDGAGGGRAATFSAESFSELPLNGYLQRQLDKLELRTMTPVQQRAIPTLLSGRDLLVRSPTGSGKTLVYAVPAVQLLLSPAVAGETGLRRSAGTYVLILVPTRELAVQTHEQIEALCRPFPTIVSSTLMGGENRKAEKARLRKGVGVLVGTPGRISDHLQQTASFLVSECRLLILDEADMLLQLGFKQTIESIIEAVAKRAAAGVKRQNVLLSATLSGDVQELAGQSLREHLTVNLGATPSAAAPPKLAKHGAAELAADEAGAESACMSLPAQQLDAPSQLRQSYVVLPPKARLTALAGFIRSRCAQAKECKLLVFLSSCDGVDFLYELLSRGKWPELAAARAASGHGAAEEATEMAAPAPRTSAADKWWDETGDSDEEGRARAGVAKGAPAAAAGLSCASAVLGTQLLRLHGKLKQQQRMTVFQRFRKLRSGVLLCTDVAARGLNLQGVHWIVQFDLPQDPREYVHRVGRTARMGQLGQALLFLHPNEAPFLQLLQAAGMQLTELSFGSMQAALCESASKAAAKTNSRDIYMMELALQRQFEACVVSEPLLHAAAVEAFQAYVRSYATHSKAVQKLLHVGQLHLGHLAKSFALKETPTTIARQQKKTVEQKKRVKRGTGLQANPKVAKRQKQGREGHSQQQMDMMLHAASGVSEFSAALD